MQKTAVVEAAYSGLMILTGGPGTGKTTTINAMIHYFEAEGLDIFPGSADRKSGETNDRGNWL